MRHVEILAQVSDRSASTIYPLLCDFKRYPGYSDAVRSVGITAVRENQVVTDWEVNFQRGILRWTEQDCFCPDTNTITFQQLEGDIDHFSGEWMVRDTGSACQIRFIADFDLGLPGLSDILEPIAEQALRTNIQSILTGLLGEPVKFISAAPH